MALTSSRILVVDDEPKYVRSLKIVLEASGYEVVTASDGETAVTFAACDMPALILLDVRMPKLDGVEACRRIREFSRVPIIMLTALAQDKDMLRGFEVGADDYVTKPFSTDVLLARVAAVLRRAAYHDPDSGQATFEAGELRVDYVQQRVFVAQREVYLTATEYRLLCELTCSAGRVVPHAVILEKVWGPGYAGEEQLIPRMIHRLRQKIEADPGAPQYILTRPGLGYVLERRRRES